MKKPVKNWIWMLLSVILLSLPWWGVTSLSLFFAFVPLLIIERRTSAKTFAGYAILTLVLWHLSTLWWVGFAAVIGVVAATLTGTVLFSIPLILYTMVRRRAPIALAYTVLVSGWVAAEYLYLNGEISFPWLVLGNGFAVSPRLVQWYDTLGALGGSLWVWIVNLTVLETIGKSGNRRYLAPALLILLPILCSLVIFYTYREKTDPVSVHIIQPNIDPYNEKFDGLSQTAQAALIERLAMEAPKNVDYIIAPETAIDDNITVGRIESNPIVAELHRFMQTEYPRSEMLIGSVLYTLYPDRTELPTPTARRLGNNAFYDVSNASLQIGQQDSVPYYFKSKLVIGVEMLPYPELLRNLPFLSVDLGGVAGMLLPQAERQVFTHPANGSKAGTAICYESVYGEFFGGFVRKGAQAMFVITNDGWWGDTFGYRNHFNYARLRAIETRRSIARSANTGISGAIDQRGEVTERIGWWQRGAVTATLNLNDKITTYVRYGDIAGRLASYVFILSLLYFGAYRIRSRGHLLEQSPKSNNGIKKL